MCHSIFRNISICLSRYSTDNTVRGASLFLSYYSFYVLITFKYNLANPSTLFLQCFQNKIELILLMPSGQKCQAISKQIRLFKTPYLCCNYYIHFCSFLFDNTYYCHQTVSISTIFKCMSIKHHIRKYTIRPNIANLLMNNMYGRQCQRTHFNKERKEQ